MLYVNDVERLKNTKINKTLPLIFYMHGFSESAPGIAGASSYEIRDGKLINLQ